MLLLQVLLLTRLQRRGVEVGHEERGVSWQPRVSFLEKGGHLGKRVKRGEVVGAKALISHRGRETLGDLIYLLLQEQVLLLLLERGWKEARPELLLLLLLLK